MPTATIEITAYHAEVCFDNLVIQTGSEETPSPFQLFLASLGACAGLNAAGYCENHELPTEGLKIIMDVERDPDTRLASAIKMQLVPPKGFPEKRKKALLRAAEACFVKRHFTSPPRFETTLAE
ncbi:MAG TPA: OsmC family protein [Firmicutes bacterium]|nr:OsmC family protein [Bacillota bacterium]